MTDTYTFTYFTLPTHWAAYLFNNDPSGLSDIEQATVDKFMADHSLPGPSDMGEDVFFTDWHDASGYGVLACDCADYTFMSIEPVKDETQ